MSRTMCGHAEHVNVDADVDVDDDDVDDDDDDDEGAANTTDDNRPTTNDRQRVT